MSKKNEVSNAGWEFQGALYKNGMPYHFQTALLCFHYGKCAYHIRTPFGRDALYRSNAGGSVTSLDPKDPKWAAVIETAKAQAGGKEGARKALAVHLETLRVDAEKRIKSNAEYEAREKLKTAAVELLPELLRALEDAAEQVAYLKPERFDDDEHRETFEHSQTQWDALILRARAALGDSEQITPSVVGGIMKKVHRKQRGDELTNAVRAKRFETALLAYIDWCGDSPRANDVETWVSDLLACGYHFARFMGFSIEPERALNMADMETQEDDDGIFSREVPWLETEDSAEPVAVKPTLYLVCYDMNGDNWDLFVQCDNVYDAIDEWRKYYDMTDDCYPERVIECPSPCLSVTGAVDWPAIQQHIGPDALRRTEEDLQETANRSPAFVAKDSE